MSETPLSRDVRYRARPTVRVEDQEVRKVSAQVNAFTITEREGGLSSLELRLNNFDDHGQFAFEDERDVHLGSNIAIYSGDEQQPGEIFRGLVSALEAGFSRGGPAELVLFAEDTLQGARLARRTRVRDDLTISALANEVAQALGLTPHVTGFTDNIGTQVQMNESDLAFLRRLLGRYDGDLQVVGRELQVSPRKDVQRGDVLELEVPRQLREARFRVDLADQVTEVTTSGWDAHRGERVVAASSGANLGPGEGRNGARLLSDTFHERSEHVGHPPVTTTDEAQALADAAFDHRARRLVVLEGCAEGSPLIRVGTHVRVTGASHRFDNTYYVVSASHKYDPVGGYRTEFEAECAYLGDA